MVIKDGNQFIVVNLEPSTELETLDAVAKYCCYNVLFMAPAGYKAHADDLDCEG
jgi:hypothetical protein